jgi:hypothetical protein
VNVEKYISTIMMIVLIGGCGQSNPGDRQAASTQDLSLQCGGKSDLVMHTDNDYFGSPPGDVDSAEEALARYLRSDEVLSGFDPQDFARHDKSAGEVIFTYVDGGARRGIVLTRQVQDEWIVSQLRICRSQLGRDA